jgi:hypothetical protein
MDVCLELPSAPSLFCPELTRLFLTGGLKQQDKFQMEPFTLTVASSAKVHMLGDNDEQRWQTFAPSI